MGLLVSKVEWSLHNKIGAMDVSSVMTIQGQGAMKTKILELEWWGYKIKGSRSSMYDSTMCASWVARITRGEKL